MLALIDGVVVQCPMNPFTKRVDIRSCLRQLHEDYHISSVLVEGGANVLQDFLENKLVDQVVVSIQPSFLGGYRFMTKELESPLNLQNVHIGSVQGNILVHGEVLHTREGQVEDGFDRGACTLLDSNGGGGREEQGGRGSRCSRD